jgi:hypothetical protein
MLLHFACHASLPKIKKLNTFASQKETTQINLNDMFETNSSDILVDDIN